MTSNLWALSNVHWGTESTNWESLFLHRVWVKQQHPLPRQLSNAQERFLLHTWTRHPIPKCSINLNYQCRGALTHRELPGQSSGKSISQSSQCSSTEIRQRVPWKHCVTGLIPVLCLHLLNVLWETCEISDPLKVDDLLPPNRRETKEC